TFRHVSPASSLRQTCQCNCMKSVFGLDGCIARRCTQKPTSGAGSGRYLDVSPRFFGDHVWPASSVQNTPAAEMAMNTRRGFFGSRMIVCRPIPPAPGCHFGPDSWPRSPGSSCQLFPPSLVRKMAASSTPAYTVSGSVSDGSRCQTRLNSQGCCVPSYHWCVVRGLRVLGDVS